VGVQNRLYSLRRSWFWIPESVDLLAKRGFALRLPHSNNRLLLLSVTLLGRAGKVCTSASYGCGLMAAYRVLIVFFFGGRHWATEAIQGEIELE
jgi:hypothetical protein